MCFVPPSRQGGALAGAPMAVLLNKADLPAAEARSDEELKLSLGLQEVAELRGKQDGALEAFRVSLVRNEGYTEALRWLADYL